MPKDMRKEMTASEMRSIRIAAGFATPEALGEELDRSERWV